MNRCGILRCLYTLLLLASAWTADLRAVDLRVGIYNNPPLISFEDEAEPSGIFIEFLESVAEAEGWNLEYSSDTFSGVLERLEEGDFDLVPAVALSYDRLKQFSFTRKPVIENWAVLYRREGVVINTIFDLKGKRVAAVMDDIHLEALHTMLDRYKVVAEVIEVDDYAAAMTELEGGRVDAALVSRTFSSRKGNLYKTTSTLLIFNPIPLHFALVKGQSHDVIHVLDRELDSQLADAESPLNMALNFWLKAEQQFTIPLWARWIGALLAVVALALLIAATLLRIMVNRRTAELQAETGRTQEALRAQTLFLATLSHELRTPLNFISGPIDLLAEDFAEDEEVKELLGDCKTGVSRLQHLVTSLLRFANVDQGGYTLDSKSVDLRNLFEEIFEIASILPKAELTELRMDKTILEGLVVMADEDAIFQITLNLVHNALKFTEKGIVRLDVVAKEEDEGVVILKIEVQDTGVSIPDKDMETIFMPFQKGTSKQFVETGAGLGLTIVKRYVDLFEGSIDVRSVPDVGSTFEVILKLPSAD